MLPWCREGRKESRSFWVTERSLPAIWRPVPRHFDFQHFSALCPAESLHPIPTCLCMWCPRIPIYMELKFDVGVNIAIGREYRRQNPGTIGKTKVPKDLQIWCEKVQFLCQTQLGLGRMYPRARRPQVVLQIRCLRKGFGTKTSMRDNQK